MEPGIDYRMRKAVGYVPDHTNAPEPSGSGQERFRRLATSASRPENSLVEVYGLSVMIPDCLQTESPHYRSNRNGFRRLNISSRLDTHIFE